MDEHVGRDPGEVVSALGLLRLRRALLPVLQPVPQAAGAGWLLSQSSPSGQGTRSGSSGSAESPGPAVDDDEGREDDSAYAASSLEDRAEGQRLIALVELARGGDAEAFGLLYDHYQPQVYRFLYYRLGSVHLAEDLTADTFFRALRSMSTFRWQGKDFGAWLMTIARNLTMDHYKAGRTRLESTTEDLGDLDSSTEGPEDAVLASLTNEALLTALGELPAEQRDCLVMRFLQGMSIAETADVLDRSPGAVKQLQLRGVRNLAKLLPEGVR
ncbi:MAG: sigma-70 family polymerase sigma factor [Marmoricola sp.]|nr:sigma-70 family polymerase sigma factor [Marmoricola sp.]